MASPVSSLDFRRPASPTLMALPASLASPGLPTRNHAVMLPSRVQVPKTTLPSLDFRHPASPPRNDSGFLSLTSYKSSLPPVLPVSPSRYQPSIFSMPRPASPSRNDSGFLSLTSYKSSLPPVRPVSPSRYQPSVLPASRPVSPPRPVSPSLDFRR